VSNPNDGQMIGFVWSGDREAHLEVRTRNDDGWSPWVAMESDGSEVPDGPEGSRVKPGVGPIWVGEDADTFETRVVDGALGDLRLESLHIEVSGGGGGLESAGAVTRPGIIPRSTWGAQPWACADPPSTARAQLAVIHHTVHPNTYSPSEAYGMVRGIQAFEIGSLGYCDLAYNFVIDRYGQIFEGRTDSAEQSVIGGHARGFNTGSIGVALLGQYQPGASPAAAALPLATYAATRDLLAYKFALHGIDPRGTVGYVSKCTSTGGYNCRYPEGTVVTLPTIVGHRDVTLTACPGDNVMSALPALRNDVTAQVYAGGHVYSSPETGTHEVHGGILQKYLSLGGPSFLGYPITDELPTPDGVGRFNHFQFGSIYWTPSTGAYEVHGGIRHEWAAMGWERSVLGYPISDELPTPDGVGRFNHFQFGSIYWTPSTGAHEVHGGIRDKWAAMGWERSVLGYPTSDELPTPDGVGRANHFQGGSIYWTPSTGGHEVHGGINEKWAAMGRERSVLGYPVTDELPTPDGVGRANHFQGGSIYWTPSIGAHEVHGGIRETWAAMGWERSVLGYPTSDEFSIPGGRRSNFEHGTISWNAATGATTVR
jgi:uncharacterized protein with LGFP repeats